MRIVRDSDEDEMVLAFLEAEVDSPRWGAHVLAALGDINLVLAPDLSDTAANDRRREALAEYRGYGTDSMLFHGFPSEVDWRLVEITASELGAVRYLCVEPWLTLSRGSLLVRDGASNIALVPAEDVNVSILAVEQAIRRGRIFPALIAAAEGESGPPILLEGHTRATAYVRALAPETAIEVIVGYVSNLTGWEWGPKP